MKKKIDYSSLGTVIQALKDITFDYVDGGYSLDEYYTGRRWIEALELAGAIQKTFDAKYLKANLNEIQEFLEDENFHTTNLALDAIFDKKGFVKQAASSMEYLMADYVK